MSPGAAAPSVTADPTVVRLRVRYPETDRMGVVHHSHFFVWFELGRTELMRGRGCAYRSLEEAGVFFPVIEAAARYRRPARYDEELEVETTLDEVTGATVRFGYRLVRPCEDGSREELARGFTVHACTGGDGRPRRVEGDLRRRLAAATRGPDAPAEPRRDQGAPGGRR